eukprot:6453792-Pyramimonas_sp.AAC.1
MWAKLQSATKNYVTCNLTEIWRDAKPTVELLNKDHNELFLEMYAKVLGRGASCTASLLFCNKQITKQHGRARLTPTTASYIRAGQVPDAQGSPTVATIYYKIRRIVRRGVAASLESLLLPFTSSYVVTYLLHQQTNVQCPLSLGVPQPDESMLD